MMVKATILLLFSVLKMASSLRYTKVGAGQCLDSNGSIFNAVIYDVPSLEQCQTKCIDFFYYNGMAIAVGMHFSTDCRCYYNGTDVKVPDGEIVWHSRHDPPAFGEIKGSDYGSGECYVISFDPDVRGDPHFKTWLGDQFSYHGECDLVLVRSNLFSKNLGVRIHIRTKIEDSWSYVKNAAIKIGDDILEVEGKGKVWDKTADAVHFINGKINAELPFQLAMKYPVERLEEKHCDTTGRKCSDAVVYKISLEDSDNILITQEWGVLRISFMVSSFNNFRDAIGIMGSFSKPGYLARDGITRLTDLNKFGQEWQVIEAEPMIFTERRTPQHPEQCILPATSTKRRLGRDSSLHQMAQDACANVEEASKKLCTLDVISSGRAEAASIYFIAAG
jgi:hypothetical protein